ncbi:MAG: hypothetical protein QF464_09065, partial [Myxococcota bacterium]|nr:hypothetical protein [Myxococcota bacterium]
ARPLLRRQGPEEELALEAAATVVGAQLAAVLRRLPVALARGASETRPHPQRWPGRLGNGRPRG